MKKLQLNHIHIPKAPSVAVGEDARTGGPEHVRAIELAWVCDKCKYRNSHRIISKGAYDEKDLLAVAGATFNLAFYDCACVDDKEEEKPTEPVIPGTDR